jgi:hypothetical protein
MIHSLFSGIVLGWDHRRIRRYTSLQEVEQVCLTNDTVLFTDLRNLFLFFDRWESDMSTSSIINDLLRNCCHSLAVGESSVTFQTIRITPQCILIAVNAIDKSSGIISLHDRLASPGIQSTLKLNEVITHVTCSSDHTLIASKTKCYVVGKGSYGQLGLGPETLETFSFVPLPNIPLNEYPISIAVSAYHSCVVTAPYGHLYTFGNGAYYRLGNGSTESNLYYPMKVESLVGVGHLNEQFIPGGICMVACSTWHTIAIAKGSNDIYGWGWNKFGQIGTDADTLTIADHKEKMITVPTRIPLFDEIEDSSSSPIQINDVKCGPRFSAFVLNDTRLFVV